jgi:outer membrane protein OmpA-like peptidoglycan-associated protein
MIKNFENFDKRMMLIESFEQYDSVNEGWKENVLVGLMSLFGLVSTGQETPKYKFPKDGRQHKIEYSQENVDKLIKRGWSLDSTSVEEFFQRIKKDAPDTVVISAKIQVDGEKFASGKYNISDEIKNEIGATLDQIVDEKGLIINITIESSTDKQGLSNNLQNELKSLGFSPDNKGLSEARSNSISEYLKSEGINGTLIKKTILSEQGEGEINQSARYVNITIHYIIKPEAGPDEDIIRGEKDVYFLSKEYGKKKRTLPKIDLNIKKTSIKKIKSSVDCPKW